MERPIYLMLQRFYCIGCFLIHCQAGLALLFIFTSEYHDATLRSGLVQDLLSEGSGKPHRRSLEYCVNWICPNLKCCFKDDLGYAKFEILNYCSELSLKNVKG